MFESDGLSELGIGIWAEKSKNCNWRRWRDGYMGCIGNECTLSRLPKSSSWHYPLWNWQRFLTSSWLGRDKSQTFIRSSS